jgi:hypothetical protein
MKMDFTKPYGHIFGGSAGECFEQDGKTYKADGTPFVSVEVASSVKDDRTIPTDSLESAKAFLKQILKGGPVAKSRVYKTAEDNNQPWTEVTKAASELNIMKFQFKDMEQWKLTEV